MQTPPTNRHSQKPSNPYSPSVPISVYRELAAELQVPLVDFHGEILARQPGTAWDGTILGKGDVHPTGGANFDFSEENLKKCGYALRNYLVCKAMKDVVEKCF